MCVSSHLRGRKVFGSDLTDSVNELIAVELLKITDSLKSDRKMEISFLICFQKSSKFGDSLKNSSEIHWRILWARIKSNSLFLWKIRMRGEVLIEIERCCEEMIEC
jgi:hypothetical protein